MGLCLSSSDGRSETPSVSSMSLEKDPEPEAKCEHIEHIKFSKITKQSQGKKVGQSPSKKGEIRSLPSKKRPNSSKRTKTNKKSGKSGKKSMLMNSENKWAAHEKSERDNRSERKVRKKKYYQNEYDLEELRRGAIVWEKRQGLQWHELEDFEDALENDVKKNRRDRRNRRIADSLDWSLH